jgi:NO-binding membrane sensor protein with MHYT domain
MNSADAAISLTCSYNMGLVLLSYVVASFASYTALHLASQITVASDKDKTIWLLGGAVAMGVGIWAMHFIAALAFMIPIPVSYDVLMTVVSVIPAIVASAIALYIVSRPSMGTAQLIIGGLLMGPGIAGMHYTGIAAMRMKGKIWYDPTLFSLSVVVAIVVSVVALWLAFHLRSQSGGIGTLQKFVSALVMGVAVVGMHFTGMAAMHVTPLDPSAVAGTPMMAEGSSWLAMGIAIATALLLTLVMLGSFASRPAAVVTTGAGSSE